MRPVLAAIPFQDEAEAIRIANGTDYGLAAGIWTRDGARQARVAKQRPLVIMTPKSLLRLPQATSRIEHLAESRFFPVLAEPRIDEEKVQRLVLCTGKIYYDLKGHATRENNEGVAISRVELLYPFPQQQILDEVARYPNLREVAWAPVWVMTADGT